ncbi:MAG: DNA primase [Parcubacteria group bacterium]
MRGDVDTIKERLDITEVISGYIKLEKAGSSFKARCPFHHEKTPSFLVSPARQSYYCFGCGAKGDIFTFVEELEGLDFKGALKQLAEKAGVELEYRKGESKTEKDEVYNVLESATLFFEKLLKENQSAHAYLVKRGLNEETIKTWRLGYAPKEWRALFSHLTALGHKEEYIFKAGLVKRKEDSPQGEPYDVFRDRIIFPLFDVGGRVIAYSGRAMASDALAKYLNSPDTILFTKSEVLYGLDKAKDEIRKKNYTVLVEGQMDLLLSHQAGVSNTVASSGTAFTASHLERLKRLSSRIILAFDGDLAGRKASEKSSILGYSLGLEVKVAPVPEGLDPAEIVGKSPEDWKDVLRTSLPSVEYLLNDILEKEKDGRKSGKLIEKNILPMINLLGSAIEQSHFISMVSKRTGIKEEALWEDLRKIGKPVVSQSGEINTPLAKGEEKLVPSLSYRERMEERLKEVKLFLAELEASSDESKLLLDEERELMDNLARDVLRSDLSRLMAELSLAERNKNEKSVKKITTEIQSVHNRIYSLEEKKKKM